MGDDRVDTVISHGLSPNITGFTRVSVYEETPGLSPWPDAVSSLPGVAQWKSCRTGRQFAQGSHSNPYCRVQGKSTPAGYLWLS